MLLTLILAAAGPAAAQEISLTLRDEATRQVVAGAIVRLRSAGRQVALAMSDARGVARFQAPGAGSYTLDVARIGFEPVVGLPVTAVDGQLVARELLLPAVAMTIPTIEVSAASRCDDHQRGGTAAAALWTSIRTALEATVLSREEELLHVVRYARAVTHRGEPGPETITGRHLGRGNPFISLPPADLARRGFVVQVGDSLEYAGVDAALLLSDAFVDTHCFQAVPGTGGLVGLAFEPVADRQLPDVEGVLWVDRRSTELRRLEFRYVQSPIPAPLAGGEVVFRRLAGGTWIVSDWYIRMPLMTDGPGRRGFRRVRSALTSYLDQGGRAVVPSAVAGPTSASIVAGVVSGRVWDSLAGTPLEGAVVRVHGVDDEARTDESGAFRLPLPRSGTVVVDIQHPRLGLVRDGSHQAVELPWGGEAVVEAAVPPIASFVRVLCGGQAGSAGIIGLTLGRSGAPEEALAIRASWLQGSGLGQAGGAGVGGAETTSVARGLFALCRLPAGRPIMLALLRGDGRLAEATITLRAGEFRWLELGGPAAPPSPP